jgi:hypothetical protein
MPAPTAKVPWGYPLKVECSFEPFFDFFVLNSRA